MAAPSHSARRPALILAHKHAPQEPEDAVFEPISSEPTALTRSRGSSKPAPPTSSILFDLQLRPSSATSAEISAERDDQHARPWGFFLGALFLVLMLAFVATLGAGGGIFALRDVLIITALAAAAVISFRFGPQGSRSRIPLLHIDVERRLLAWPSRHPQSSAQAELVLAFEEIEEVVFGMIYFPVSPSRPDSRIHMFTLLVRDRRRGELVPIVEATPDKRAAFLIAQQVSRLTNAPLTQVGEGVWGSPHP